jgi:hypothetical protein
MGRSAGAQANPTSIAASLEIADASMPWRSLPGWLGFFFQLGERVAAAQEAGSRTCAVVVPPVRSFAAVFVATGAAVGAATTSEAVPDADTHFASLASLDKGTALVVKMGERIYAARFSGVTERAGNEYIKIEYDGMTHYLPKQECHRAQVGGGGKRSLPKMGQRSRAGTTAVVEDLLGDCAGDFLSIPTVDTVLVGKVTLLEQELNEVKIRAAGRGAAMASLGALLRPSRFLPDGGIPRSLLISDRVSEFSMPVNDVPHVAVFDGPRALARHRLQFPESSWVAVLDRCSTSFREGVDVANEEFAVRKGPAPYFDDIDVPPGTEAQAFERGR